MNTTNTIERTYTELIKLDTFEERFGYLRLSGELGARTFGWDRPLNQKFYQSVEWKRIRNFVIYRDQGLDLAMDGFLILDSVVIHHMNPLVKDSLENFDPKILDPEFLITTSAGTHKAIHYNKSITTPRLPPTRRPGDTQLW